jgi:hypothetical protein
MPCCHPHLTLIPRNLYTIAVLLQISPVHAWSTAVCTTEKATICQADDYVEYGEAG